MGYILNIGYLYRNLRRSNGSNGYVLDTKVDSITMCGPGNS